MTRTFWVYIVASISGTLYIGVTNNIERRAFAHKEGLIDGFSKRYDCKRLVYFEEFSDIRSAIESVNPKWQDLAKDWGWQMLMPNESIAEAKTKAEWAKRLSAASKR
jgi:putative endonuclease